eukprot:GHVS01073843.1.p1 GENE.GHVS01073843.1~~GHVS01073843.1.p1  ORF type:complete len:920 (+),score=172.47 GHVS01073843.1:197-2956(+)
MKFGEKLECYAVAEWSDRYIRYKHLKKILKKLKAALASTPSRPQTKTVKPKQQYTITTAPLPPIGQPRSSIISLSASCPSSSSSVTSSSIPLLSASTQQQQQPLQLLPPLPPPPAPQLHLLPVSSQGGDLHGGGESAEEEEVPRLRAVAEFGEKLEAEMKKVEEHFTGEKTIIEDRLTAVDQELQDILNNTPPPNTMSPEIPLSSPSSTPPPLSGVRSPLSHNNSSPPNSAPLTPPMSAPTHLPAPPQPSQNHPPSPDNKAELAHLKRLQKSLVSIWERIDLLEGFVKLNTMALYKILKKRDKLLGVHYILQDLRSWRGRLCLLVVEENIKATLLNLYRQAATELRLRGEGGGHGGGWGGEEEDVTTLDDLQAMVQKDFMKQVRPNYAPVSCFLGACAVLVLDIVVMCYLPATNPNYDLLQVLAVFPIFRIVLMGILITWFTAGAMSVMEHFGVNYRFMLEVDPKCQVNASTLFTLASIQTTLWIVAMGLFLVDYKFLIFGAPAVHPSFPSPTSTVGYIITAAAPNGDDGSLGGGSSGTDGNSRSFTASGGSDTRGHHSWWWWWLGWSGIGRGDYYWIYPTVLLLLQFLLLFLPNRTFRFRYRKQIIHVLYMVFTCFCFSPKEITLVQNVMGDILTSFAHPLGDLEYTACYFITGLPSTPASCPSVSPIVKPLIFAFPFYLRLCQCLVRYRREAAQATTTWEGFIHLANAGKYVSGLTVVVCAAIPWNLWLGSSWGKVPWVSAYVIATVYMFVWDVYIDWGFDSAYAEPSQGVAFIRRSGSRMYPQWMYVTIAVLNLFGRSTWAMTLMPIEILADKELNATLIALVVSAIEIMRRSAWTLLRLENEHLTNSSKYRAMLWVPRLYAGGGADIGERGEVEGGDAASWRIRATKSGGSEIATYEHGAESAVKRAATAAVGRR